ncbi:MAG TPA: PhoH family protein [Clostridia bacterium]|nr:PhoH family protein [Clostridia bacterium]HRX43002.1 PhoH family protein [Clostridia bacterium]
MEKTIGFDNIDHVMNLFGSQDENVRAIEEIMGVSIVPRGTDIKIIGDDDNVLKTTEVIEKLMRIARDGDAITRQNSIYIATLMREGAFGGGEYPADYVCLNANGKPIKSKTFGQQKYVETIKNNDIVFGIGPAGTGKTFLAVAMAVTAFRSDQVKRIILTRPAVEAGEKLGFLPGDLQSKIDPYLRPLYDSLFEIMGAEAFQRSREKGLIEIVPLAYMRGRTLDDSFIILDEAQNTTKEQMKMFLTRMGFYSKVVVTGDITQIDLPGDKKSGLLESEKILKNVKGIGFSYLTDRDVVRHELVQRIIRAYDRYENKAGKKG